FFTLVLLLSLGAACSKSAPPPEPAAEDAAPGEAPPPPAAPVRPVPAALPAVVARVNGAAITKEDIESAVHDIEAQASQELPGPQRDRVIRMVLDQLITARLLTQESAARKIRVTNAEIDGRIAR